MDYAIMILDAIITGALYLSPVIILRFAILKKGLKALSAAFVVVQDYIVYYYPKYRERRFT